MSTMSSYKRKWGGEIFIFTLFTIMKNNKYLAFAQGEITVYCGDHAGANIHQSLQQAREIAVSSRRGNIMYINTIYTTRRLLAAARRDLGMTDGQRVHPTGDDSTGEQAAPGTKEGIFFRHVIGGDLCKYLDEIREAIKTQQIKYLIVNSWDFANRNYGFKEKALFGLLHIANELNVAVIIYSQAYSRGAVAGEIHRGGLGKLASIANEIIRLRSDEILEDMRSGEIKVKILSDKKINELDYARSETGVSSSGELILPTNEVESEVLFASS